MPEGPIEGGSERDYPSDMEARVRVLEEIAAGTKTVLSELRADQRTMRVELTASIIALRGEIAASAASLRAEMGSGDAALRTEMVAGNTSLRAEMMAMEQRRERDFRITFGAIITTTLGLAFLIARSAHWL